MLNIFCICLFQPDFWASSPWKYSFPRTPLSSGHPWTCPKCYTVFPAGTAAHCSCTVSIATGKWTNNLKKTGCHGRLGNFGKLVPKYKESARTVCSEKLLRRCISNAYLGFFLENLDWNAKARL